MPDISTTRPTWLADSIASLAQGIADGHSQDAAFAMHRLLRGLEMDDIPGPFLRIEGHAIEAIWCHDYRMIEVRITPNGVGMRATTGHFAVNLAEKYALSGWAANEPVARLRAGLGWVFPRAMGWEIGD